MVGSTQLAFQHCSFMRRSCRQSFAERCFMIDMMPGACECSSQDPPLGQSTGSRMIIFLLLMIHVAAAGRQT